MSAVLLVSIDAAIEAATGLALILFPDVVAHLLFAGGLAGAGIAMARVGGITLLAMALAWWAGREARGMASMIPSLVAFNILATAYLVSLGVQSELVGLLLWPAIVFHAAMGLLLAVAWLLATTGAHLWAEY